MFNLLYHLHEGLYHKMQSVYIMQCSRKSIWARMGSLGVCIVHQHLECPHYHNIGHISPYRTKKSYQRKLQFCEGKNHWVKSWNENRGERWNLHHDPITKRTREVQKRQALQSRKNFQKQGSKRFISRMPLVKVIPSSVEVRPNVLAYFVTKYKLLLETRLIFAINQKTRTMWRLAWSVMATARRNILAFHHSRTFI